MRTTTAMRVKMQQWTVRSCASHSWPITSSTCCQPSLSEPRELLSPAQSRAEKMHDDSTRASETCLIGLCTGLFAATAIASSPSLSGLVPIAVQMVLMAFRTGAYVAAMAERLHKASSSSSSWTYVLPGINEVAASSIISNFHKTNVRIPDLLHYVQLTHCSAFHLRATHTPVQSLPIVLPLVDRLPL
jgi:hypothetical protein